MRFQLVMKIDGMQSKQIFCVFIPLVIVGCIDSPSSTISLPRLRTRFSTFLPAKFVHGVEPASVDDEDQIRIYCFY